MKSRRIIFAIILVAVGVIWIANVYDLIQWDWLRQIQWSRIWLPLVIVIIGIGMFFKALRPKKSKEPSRLEGEFKMADASNDCQVAFGGKSMNFGGKKFEGVSVSCFFGGAKIDLHGADIVDRCTMNVHALFGGVEIYAPDDVDFVIKSNSFCGGVDDERHNSPTPKSKIILVNASCMFGGVEIK